MILKIQACPLQDDPEEGDGVGNKSHFLVHILPKSYSQPIFSPNPELSTIFFCAISTPSDQGPICPMKNSIGKSHLHLQVPQMMMLCDEITYTLNLDISLIDCSKVVQMLRFHSLLSCPSSLQ